MSSCSAPKQLPQSHLAVLELNSFNCHYWIGLRASFFPCFLANWTASCLLSPRVASEAARKRWAEQADKGGTMSVNMLQRSEVEDSAEQKLWRAVIASTVEEWVSGPLRRKREAEQFLFSDNKDYRTVCYSAGIDPENLRARLEKIRSREIAEAQARATRN